MANAHNSSFNRQTCMVNSSKTALVDCYRKTTSVPVSRRIQDDGDDAEKVVEGSTIFPVVDDSNLDLLVVGKGSLHLFNGKLVDFTCRALHRCTSFGAWWCL